MMDKHKKNRFTMLKEYGFKAMEYYKKAEYYSSILDASGFVFYTERANKNFNKYKILKSRME